MKHNKSVFHQLLKQLPPHQFQKVVDRHINKLNAKDLKFKSLY